jgi:hypothetical protein
VKRKRDHLKETKSKKGQADIMYSRKAETIYTTNLKNGKRSKKSEIAINDSELDTPMTSCFGRNLVNIFGVMMPR